MKLTSDDAIKMLEEAEKVATDSKWITHSICVRKLSWKNSRKIKFRCR